MSDSASNEYPPVPEWMLLVSLWGGTRLAPTATMTKQAQQTSAALKRLRPGFRTLLRKAIRNRIADSFGVIGFLWGNRSHTEKKINPVTKQKLPIKKNNSGDEVLFAAIP